jgi:ABC-type multidrug transport system fused ATPase/permease subunit
MGLHTLRQHLSVIPQTPFLFKGSVKSNLDPFEEKTDEELWNALEHSGLRGKIQSV